MWFTIFAQLRSIFELLSKPNSLTNMFVLSLPLVSGLSKISYMFEIIAVNKKLHVTIFYKTFE